jgi:hypothetical protein
MKLDEQAVQQGLAEPVPALHRPASVRWYVSTAR